MSCPQLGRRVPLTYVKGGFSPRAILMCGLKQQET
jgi:hypothetical protein